jgi:predicted DNA binding CopG/RHH family protein
MEVKMAKLATEMTKEELDELIANQVLDEEEQEIENAVASGLLKPSQISPERAREWKEAAEETLRKSPITLRVSNDVIRRLRMKARLDGLPYQTLANSILHKFVHGRLKERD